MRKLRFLSLGYASIGRQVITRLSAKCPDRTFRHPRRPPIRLSTPNRLDGCPWFIVGWWKKRVAPLLGSRQPVKKVAEYRQHADECRHLANLSGSAEHRQILLD